MQRRYTLFLLLLASGFLSKSRDPSIGYFAALSQSCDSKNATPLQKIICYWQQAKLKVKWTTLQADSAQTLRFIAKTDSLWAIYELTKGNGSVPKELTKAGFLDVDIQNNKFKKAYKLRFSEVYDLKISKAKGQEIFSVLTTAAGPSNSGVSTAAFSIWNAYRTNKTLRDTLAHIVLEEGSEAAWDEYGTLVCRQPGPNGQLYYANHNLQRPAPNIPTPGKSILKLHPVRSSGISLLQVGMSPQTPLDQSEFWVYDYEHNIVLNAQPNSAAEFLTPTLLKLRNGAGWYLLRTDGGSVSQTFREIISDGKRTDEHQYCFAIAADNSLHQLDKQLHDKVLIEGNSFDQLRQVPGTTGVVAHATDGWHYWDGQKQASATDKAQDMRPITPKWFLCRQSLGDGECVIRRFAAVNTDNPTLPALALDSGQVTHDASRRRIVVAWPAGKMLDSMQARVYGYPDDSDVLAWLLDSNKPACFVNGYRDKLIVPFKSLLIEAGQRLKWRLTIGGTQKEGDCLKAPQFSWLTSQPYTLLHDLDTYYFEAFTSNGNSLTDNYLIQYREGYCPQVYHPIKTVQLAPTDKLAKDQPGIRIPTHSSSPARQ